jgi:hypothetical protein
METIYKEESFSLNAILITPSDHYALHSQKKDFVLVSVIYSELPSSKGSVFAPVPWGWTCISSWPLSNKAIHSMRERNPFDVPPGPGYAYLKKTGAYIPMKTHVISNVVCPSPHRRGGHMESIYDPYDGQTYTWKVHFYAVPPFPANRLALFGIDSVAASGYQAVYDRALKNLYASLKKRTKVNGGVLIAELGESVGLLGKASITILSVVRALKSGRIKDAYRILKAYGVSGSPKKLRDLSEVNRKLRKEGKKPLRKSEYASSAWLELQFGWLPVLKDIYDIVKYINELLSDPNASPWLAFTGYADSRVSGGANHPDTFPNYYDKDNMSFNASYRVSITATFQMQNNVIDFLNSIGLIDPLAVAWEVVPFSFVVDWFYPVGDMISSMHATAGLELLEYGISVKEQGLISLPFKSDFTENDGGSLAPVEFYRENFTRVVNPTEQIPPMPFVSSSFSEIFSLWKITTSLALLKQVFGRST